MEENTDAKVERWLRHQAHADTTIDQHKNEDDGLTSSPEFQEPSLSPSPSPTSTPPLSPQLPLITPHQPPLPPQHVSTVSGRPRPLLRMRTYGSIILPPTSSVKSKMGAHQPLLEVRGVHRSGSLSPLSWFDPPTSPSHKSGHLAVVGRCRSQSPVADHSNGGVDSDDSLDNGKITSNDSSDDLVTERQLQLLAPKIGSKLQLVTSLLGLQESDYTGIKVPEFQALCVLKKWLVDRERKVGDLCHVLEKAELPQLAEWCRFGVLEEQLKKHEEQQKAKRREQMKRDFPGSFDVSRVDASDSRSKPKLLSESRLLKHNTINSGLFHFQHEEK